MVTSASSPPGGIDTHVHVLDPARFPYVPQAPYHPEAHETGTVADLAWLLDAHGMHGAVIVDPTSGYDGDSRCMLDALERLGERSRGIARWSPRRKPLDHATLASLKRQGVAGVRVDFIGDGIDLVLDPAFHALIDVLADLDLVLDVQCEQDQMCRIAPVLARVPARVVVDHIGRPDPALGVDQPGFSALVHLIDRGDVYVKLSGPMRMSQAPGWLDVDPFVRALVENRGTEVLVWGSDWPFLRCQRRMDYGPLLALLDRWLPSAVERERVMVTNPRALFGFHAVGA